MHHHGHLQDSDNDEPTRMVGMGMASAMAQALRSNTSERPERENATISRLRSLCTVMDTALPGIITIVSVDSDAPLLYQNGASYR